MGYFRLFDTIMTAINASNNPNASPMVIFFNSLPKINPTPIAIIKNHSRFDKGDI
jgi:hypothetical protein